ncbi:MAG: 2-C-methyl-D-erythritol 4-phosphate cytidylyltransferase [Salinivirgaceae bacterium]|nr:MAG: 2-C-methyl-D-erythritol 4-phosphate cytidylyltransferase [Salinivirgaceae bacterium]
MSLLKTCEKAVIIVAGGSGKRFGSEVPKQFLEITGKPVLMHTIERFREAFTNVKIVVVLPEVHHETWENLCNEHQFEIEHEVAKGGKERFDSVKNGLEKVTDCELVGVQDGVRPLTSVKLIQSCYDTAFSYGACVPAIPVADSLRKGNKTDNKPVSREGLFRVQTPQVFRYSWLLKAYEQPFDSSFTDDASVIEKAGHKIILVDGEESNIKITRQEDLQLAEFYLLQQD